MHHAIYESLIIQDYVLVASHFILLDKCLYVVVSFMPVCPDSSTQLLHQMQIQRLL